MKWAVRKQEIGRKKTKVCYTITGLSQELLNGITTHSILSDSGTINSRGQEWWPVCPILLFFFCFSFLFFFYNGRWPAGCRERINHSPRSQSPSYQRAAGWNSEAKRDTSPAPQWLILWSPAHNHRGAHTQRHVYILSTHTPTPASRIFIRK